MSAQTHARAVDDFAEAIGQPRLAERVLNTIGERLYQTHYEQEKIIFLRDDFALFAAKQRHPSGKNFHKKEATRG